METKKNVILGTGDGLKEVLRPCPLHIVGSQQSGKRFGFKQGSPKVKSSLVGMVESHRYKVR